MSFFFQSELQVSKKKKSHVFKEKAFCLLFVKVDRHQMDDCKPNEMLCLASFWTFS